MTGLWTIAAHAWPPTPVEVMVGVAVGAVVVALYYLVLRFYVGRNGGARSS